MWGGCNICDAIVSKWQKNESVLYCCDNWDSNPDLEHGKLEFYP